MVTPISPKKVIVGALASVLAELPVLVKALAIPGIIFLVLKFFPVTEISETGAIVFAIVSLLLHTVFAITTHRIIMLGPESMPEWGLRSWSKRETRFLGYLLVFILMISVLVAFSIVSQPIGPMIAMVVAIIGGCTLTLVFPAVAIEEEFTLGDAWRMAQGHIGSLIVCIGLFTFLLGILTILVSSIPYALPLAAILELGTNVLTIAVLSVAFGEIRRAQAER